MMFDPEKDYHSNYNYTSDLNAANSEFMHGFNTTNFNRQLQFSQLSYRRSKSNLSYSSRTTDQDKNAVTYRSNLVDFDNEPPLLEELGINFDHILQKTVIILNPFKEENSTILQETDLAGPLLFCLTFGILLLFKGKVQFGSIYGVSVFACLFMYMLLNLMSESDVSLECTISILGYCLLPMVILSGLSILWFDDILFIFTLLGVLWCSLSASKFFARTLNMDHLQPLIGYPCAVLYAVFALLMIF